jgi:hypothetical protein
MKRLAWSAILPVAAAAALIAGSAAWEGSWSGRWSAPAAQGVEFLADKAPAAVGDWDREGGPVRIDTAPAAIQYVYHRAKTRSTVVLCLAAGSRRDLALHGPQACYPQLSLRLLSGPERVVLAADKLQAEASAASYSREESAGRRRLEALWTSRCGATWAPGAGTPADGVIKLYLFTEDALAQSDARLLLADFAKLLLPELECVTGASR